MRSPAMQIFSFPGESSGVWCDLTRSEERVPRLLGPPSFLLAERDRSLREILAAITEESFPDAAVYLASNEAEALATLPRLRPPCVAVLHWSLIEGGAATLTVFRDAGIPVLLTSGWGSSEISGSGPVGARLRKPFDLHVYVGRLTELLATWPDPSV